MLPFSAWTRNPPYKPSGLDPVLPLSPGRVERHGFEYYRHGTLSLYAALDVKTGKVHGKTAARHTSEEFVDFLQQVVALCKPRQEIHLILDNLSAHKTKKVDTFLEQHPQVKLHFTPTYSSWLNQVEIWFARIERDVIARGVFNSVKDLARKLMRYIRSYSKAASFCRKTIENFYLRRPVRTWTLPPMPQHLHQCNFRSCCRSNIRLFPRKGKPFPVRAPRSY
jgi:transposase